MKCSVFQRSIFDSFVTLIDLVIEWNAFFGTSDQSISFVKEECDNRSDNENRCQNTSDYCSGY